MSLKNDLKEFVYSNKSVSINQLEEFIKISGHKISNGERRMRELAKETKIAPMRNKKGVVVGYYIKDEKTPQKAAQSLSWRAKAKIDQEQYKIKNMPRDEKGRLIACG